MNGFELNNNSQILIISPEPWKWQHVSKHHYAITLANMGYKVYFLNPPITTSNQIEILNTKYANLYKIETPQVTKGLRFYPKSLRVFLEKKWLKKLENIIGEKFTTIWLFENSRFYNMEFAEDRLKIYHQVDSCQNFHIKEATSSADICFCTTDFIKRDLLPYNQKVFKVSHGINFKTDKTSLTKEEKNRFSHTNIHIAYIGNLDMIYINEDILYSLTNKYSNITFHFVGSYSQKGALYQICKEMKNIIWWGRVDSSLIPAILEQVDINLLVYRAEEYPEQLANSHKILEYLNSGKIIVATYTDEYKDKRHLLEMVNSSKDYIQKFDEVINNLEFYNSKEKHQERISFAKEHSYEKQLEKIISLIKKNDLKGL